MELLHRVEAFLKKTAMPPSVFGRAAVHDPRLVVDLRNGREPGVKIRSRVEHFMNKWQEDAREGRAAPQGDRRTLGVCGKNRRREENRGREEKGEDA